MKKLILLLVLVFVAGNSAAQTVITTPEELQDIVSNLTGNYILGNDIDLTGFAWAGIGHSGQDPFTGTFDGNFFVINGLTATDNNPDDGPYKNASLFGIVGPGGVVKNLGMTNVDVTGGWYAAAMVGDLRGDLTNCYVESGTVTLKDFGGNGGTMVGLVRDTGVVTDCYSTADLVILAGEFPQYKGGFTGGFGGPATNCYFAGTITGDGATSLTGTHIPFAGYISEGVEVTSCYYDKDLVDIEEAGDLNMGRTTAEMMTPATFVDWDFEDIWFINEGVTYPTFTPVPGAMDPVPANGETIQINANLVLGWGLLSGEESDDVWVEVWFGTEPNELHPGYDMTNILVKSLNTTSYDSVDVSAEDTYYWWVNSWVDDKIDDANMITGGLWHFHTVNDVAPTVEIVTLDQMTWSGEGALLDSTVTDDSISELTIAWTADAASLADPNFTIDILNADQADATVTITKTGPTDDVVTVTMTVTVSDAGNPTEPDTASIEIDVYNDACHVARVGLGLIAETDFIVDCITDLEELAEMVEAWLDDYSATGSEDVSVAMFAMAAAEAGATLIAVPNGSFEEIYKPGSTTITADLDGGWTTGVGPDTPLENPQGLGHIAIYSDGTTGDLVDIPGWINAGAPWDIPPYSWTQGSGHVASQDPTPEGVAYFGANGSAWGNTPGGACESDAPLGQIIGGASYTLSMIVTGPLTPVVLDLLADDVVLTPSSTVDPGAPYAWDEVSKTYDALDLAGHVGESLRIRVGWGPTPEDDETQNQSHLDLVTLEVDNLLSPSPYHGETVKADESLELSWVNLDGVDSNDVYVDVWFGTEPNDLLPGYDMIKVLDASENTESVLVDASAIDTYYWQVNTYINGADNLNIENMIEGPSFLFHTTDDLAPTVEIVTLDQRTWSGESVAIDSTVSDDGESVMTILWAADDDSLADTNLTIDILNADQADPTVTITKTEDTDDVVTVTMTVTVSDLANPTTPDTASIEIDVYDDACHMAQVGQGKSAITDLSGNCITNLEDLAVVAGAWLDDYAVTGQLDRP